MQSENLVKENVIQIIQFPKEKREVVEEREHSMFKEYVCMYRFCFD